MPNNRKKKMQQTLQFTVSFVVDSVLTVVPAVLPHGVAGQAYPLTAVATVSGGVAPYTYSVVSGLPSGMALSTDGKLSGTPTAAGNASVVIKVQDSGTP